MRVLSNLFRDEIFAQKLNDLMLPISLQTLLLNAVSLGDAFMLGAVSQEALAAVSLASQVYFVLLLFIETLTGGATIISAQYLGKRERDMVECVYCLILRYAMLISIVFFLLTSFCPIWLIRLFTDESKMIAIGADYLRIAGISYLFSGISQCYLCMMKVEGRAKSGAAITTSIVIFDLILNAVFIFGLFGLPAMGAKGAALTTVITKALEMVIVTTSSLAGNHLRPKLNRMFAVKPKLEQEFWYYSFPVFLNAMAWGGGITVYSAIMGHLGTNATAAYSIVTVIKNLITCISIGMGSAAGIMLGKELGKNNLALGKEYAKSLCYLTFPCGVISVILTFVVGYVLMLLFQIDEITNTYLSQMLIWCAVNCFGRCINDTVINGIFGAGGDTKFDAQSLVVTMWGIIMPFAFCAAFWWDLPVVWVYFIICMDEIIKLPWVYIHYKKYLWLRNITKEAIG